MPGMLAKTQSAHACTRCGGCCAGTGEVIKAWDRGVAGMRVGDKRRITAPPQVQP